MMLSALLVTFAIGIISPQAQELEADKPSPEIWCSTDGRSDRVCGDAPGNVCDKIASKNRWALPRAEIIQVLGRKGTAICRIQSFHDPEMDRDIEITVQPSPVTGVLSFPANEAE